MSVLMSSIDLIHFYIIASQGKDGPTAYQIYIYFASLKRSMVVGGGSKNEIAI